MANFKLDIISKINNKLLVVILYISSEFKSENIKLI